MSQLHMRQLFMLSYQQQNQNGMLYCILKLIFFDGLYMLLDETGANSIITI